MQLGIPLGHYSILAVSGLLVVRLNNDYSSAEVLSPPLITVATLNLRHGIDQRAWWLDIVGKSFLIFGCTMLLAFAIGEYCFGNLLVSIILFCKKCTQLNLVPNSGKFLPFAKIGVPLGVFSFLSTLFSSIPRLFRERWYGENILGIFGSITTITVLVPFVGNKD